jgi:hypothetical protein
MSAALSRRVVTGIDIVRKKIQEMAEDELKLCIRDQKAGI